MEHQLDRLDSILDGLADALNEAVADAVGDAAGVAVKEAVPAVVSELVSNPAVAKKVAEAHGFVAEADGASQPVTPTWEERLEARLRQERAAVARAKNRAAEQLLGVARP